MLSLSMIYKIPVELHMCSLILHTSATSRRKFMIYKIPDELNGHPGLQGGSTFENADCIAIRTQLSNDKVTNLI